MVIKKSSMSTTTCRRMMLRMTLIWLRRILKSRRERPVVLSSQQTVSSKVGMFWSCFFFCTQLCSFHTKYALKMLHLISNLSLTVGLMLAFSSISSSPFSLLRNKPKVFLKWGRELWPRIISKAGSSLICLQLFHFKFLRNWISVQVIQETLKCLDLQESPDYIDCSEFSDCSSFWE